MKIRKLFALVPAFCVALAGFASADEDAVIRVGNVCYSADTVSRDITAVYEALSESGGVVDSDSLKEGISEVVQQYIVWGIAENMLRDAGEWEIDDNTDYALREAAQKQYDEYWTYLRNGDGLSALDDLGITKYMNDAGITVDLVYDEILRNYRFENLLSMNCVDCTVSDEDVDLFYEETIVAPYRERYENNIPLFEEEVLYADNAMNVYAPEGYRQLLVFGLSIPEDIQAQLDDCASRAQESIDTANKAYQQIAAMAINDEDITDQKSIYQQAMNEYDQLEVEYGEIRASILPALREQTDEVYARLLSGETFESIVGGANYSNLLLYHTKSEAWPDTIRAAADSLESVGDISDPAVTAEGVYILYYYADMEGGTIEPDEEYRETIRALAEQDCFGRKLISLTNAHRGDYSIEIDLSGIPYASQFEVSELMGE